VKHVHAPMQALAEGNEDSNPGCTANTAREHVRAINSWAWEQELIDTALWFQEPRCPA
jgi:hypothetical protein